MRRLSFSVARAGRLEQKRDITLPVITLIVTLAATFLVLAIPPAAMLGSFLDTMRGALDLVIGLSVVVMLVCAMLAPVLLTVRLLAAMRRWVW